MHAGFYRFRRRIGLKMADVSASVEEKDPLYDAVRQCCVYVLLMFPPDAIRSWRSGARDTLLHVAVIYNCPEAIPILAPHVDVNARNAYGETALDIAARIGDVEAVRLLLEAGADPTVVNKYGDTPLMRMDKRKLKTDLELTLYVL
jgi:FOG: Ankyrin repeat